LKQKQATNDDHIADTDIYGKINIQRMRPADFGGCGFWGAKLAENFHKKLFKSCVMATGIEEAFAQEPWKDAECMMRMQ